MRIKSLHIDHIMPTKGSEQAGAYDIYMPESGSVGGLWPTKVALGFAAEVPQGHVALLLPRSGVGTTYSVELNNTCGVIDADYRGEWCASLRTKDGMAYTWDKGARVLQFIIVPVLNVTLVACDELSNTQRNTGGFGSSGQ